MINSIKEKIYERKAQIYLDMLLDSFYDDYSKKIRRKESTLKCTGSLTLTNKDVNYIIMNKLFDKAWDMGAIVIEKHYEDLVFLKLAEQGRGIKHTLKIQKRI